MSQATIPQLIAIHGARYQALEDLIHSLILARTVAYATAGTLDRVGALVGQKRPTPTTDDTAYRSLILGRVVANASHGQPEAILALMRLIGADMVSQRGAYPAGLALDFSGALIVDNSTLLSLLEQVTAPVRLIVTQYTADAFGFASDPDAFGFGEGVIARSIT